MPDVIFDIEQQRNYHLAEGRRVWHEVPRGYEFDAEGRLWPVDAVQEDNPAGGFLPCEEQIVSMNPIAAAAAGFDAIDEPTETAAEDTGASASAEVKKHGRSNRST